MGKKLQFAGEIHMASSAEYIAQVKVALRLPADARLAVVRIERGSRGEALLDYTVTLQVTIEGAEFGAASGVTVDEVVTAQLRFDSRGVLQSQQTTAVDERHLRLVKDNLRKLAAADQIYLPLHGEVIDPERLRAQHKAWYVETDADGRKRLKRAYMAHA